MTDKPFSIVIPDRTIQKIQISASMWGRGLSDLVTNDYPLMPMVGAPDIASAYNSALEKVTTEYVIFSHSDAHPLSYPRYFLGQRLLERMRDADILGFCGSDRFCGPSWQTSGSLYGVVINHPPLPDPLDANSQMQLQTGMRPASVAVWQRPARLIRGIRVADGYCIVARTEALKKLGGFWTPESCKHWHFYDLNLFLQASEAGLRTAIASDIYISHSSHGSYQQSEWSGGLEEFMEKWGGKADPTYGVASVHGTLQSNDARQALIYLQQQERHMVDELNLRKV